MADIFTLGELLIDLTQTGADEMDNGIYTAFPGGAPANVAVAASRLGAKTAFIGKVGNDVFGRGLARTLDNEGVDKSGLYIDEKNQTTLAIVAVDKDGEREFSFYRNPGADTQLTAEEAVGALAQRFEGGNEAEGTDSCILHVGSLSLTNMPVRDATFAAVKYAGDKGMLISYDPNYREALWDNEQDAIEMMKKLLPEADILKVSEEEMLMLTGTEDFEEGSRILAENGAALVLVTIGAKGVFARFRGKGEIVPGFSVKVADTNGAGDTFLGAMLAQISGIGREGLEKLEWDELRNFIVYANKAASLTCSRPGAIPAMTTAREMEDAGYKMFQLFQGK